MTTEQDAKSKVHLRLLGRSIGLPSEAREVIEIVWKAAAEFFQAQQPMPAWMQYDPATDVLTIHGRKYSAALFGRDGFLGDPGDLLRIEKGNDETVKVTRIPIDQQAEPVGNPDCWRCGGDGCSWCKETHPAQPVQPVEPVAWAETDEHGEIAWGEEGCFSNDPAWIENPIPLYAHPAPAPAVAVNDQLLERVDREKQHIHTMNQFKECCRGTNCTSTKARPIHSQECMREHDSLHALQSADAVQPQVAAAFEKCLEWLNTWADEIPEVKALNSAIAAAEAEKAKGGE